VPIRALVPEVDVPAGLDAIVLKCLTKKPEGRYGTMDELLADLEKLEQGLLPDAVNEMMARSGGFNVPADYFRAAMPAPVPASPMALQRKRWPLYALMGAVGTIVGSMAVVMVVKSSTGKAQPLAAPSAVSVVPAPTVAMPETASADGPSLPAQMTPPGPIVSAAPAASPSEPLSKEILISVVPSDATITQDGKTLGESPVALHLAPGEHAVLVVERRGFKTKEFTVASDPPKQTLTLEAIGGALPAKPRHVDVKPAAPPPPSGIDDVGDPFATKH
jgi:eukaryotic-like serine/threonine-protein kinase